MDRKDFIAHLESTLEVEEAVRLKPYSDSRGILTIGIGRNLRDKGISKEEAYHLCNNDIEEVEADLDHHLSWWRRLDDTRQLVLADMTFNMGIHAVLKFDETLGLIFTGKYSEAADHMLASLWAKQVGKRATHLADLMRKGGNIT